MESQATATKRRLLFGLAGISLIACGFTAVVMVDKLGRSRSGFPAPPDTACKHGMVAAQCPFCDESLVERKGFCTEHGVPEAYCTTCDPGVAVAFKAVGDWCGGHDVPESQCTLCNPGVLDMYATVAPAVSPPPVELVPIEERPRYQRLPSVTCTTQNVRVQFRSSDIAAAAGLEYTRVERRKVSQTLTCNAVVAYDANRHAQCSARAGGVIADITATLGQRVVTGDILAVVDSAELTTAKAEYLRLWHEADAARALVKQAAEWFDRVNRMEVRLTANDYLGARALLSLARTTLEREETLFLNDATSERELTEARNAVARADNAADAQLRRLVLFGISAEAIAALEAPGIGSLEGRGTTSEQPVIEARQGLASLEARMHAARNHLRVFGFADAQIERIRVDNDVRGLLPVAAPFGGIVVECGVALGEVVDTGQTWFVLADTSRMWALLDVYGNDMMRIREGLPVVVDVGGLPGRRHGGRITWISSDVDPRTRTLKARAELANPDGLLRAGMFAKAIVTVAEDDPALVVPKEAVQWEGCCNVVFVKRNDVLFEPRKVRLGCETDRLYEVQEGLSDGDEVVTTGSFALKTEILKGSIGAGCCEVQPGKE